MLSSLMIVMTIILFFYGISTFTEEFRKVNNYIKVECHVDSISTKTIRCRTRHMTYSCYSPVWKLYYRLNNEKRDVTIEDDQKYEDLSYALAQGSTFQVDFEEIHEIWSTISLVYDLDWQNVFMLDR